MKGNEKMEKMKLEKEHSKVPTDKEIKEMVNVRLQNGIFSIIDRNTGKVILESCICPSATVSTTYDFFHKLVVAITQYKLDTLAERNKDIRKRKGKGQAARV